MPRTAFGSQGSARYLAFPIVSERITVIAVAIRPGTRLEK